MPDVVQIVRVRAIDVRSVERERAVEEIERIAGRLDLHQRIQIARALDAYHDAIPDKREYW